MISESITPLPGFPQFSDAAASTANDTGDFPFGMWFANANTLYLCDEGTVTVWAVTSTTSQNPDTGADPSKLVLVTDVLAATTLPGGTGGPKLETFSPLGAGGGGLSRRRAGPREPSRQR